MPVIRSLSRTTPRTPTLATPERHLASSAPAEPTPPALPPKRQRSKTTSQTSTKFEPCLPSRVAAFSHGNGVRNDVPPPLPPKQRMPVSTETCSVDISQGMTYWLIVLMDGCLAATRCNMSFSTVLVQLV